MPLLADPPTDEITRTACVLLGRALYIAPEFEDDCRSLAFILKLREPQSDGQSDDEFFATVSKAVLGRLVDLNKLIIRRGKIKEDYAEMLHDARNARNYIAHEAIGNLEGLMKLPGGFGQWQGVLASKLEEVAFGRIIVAVLLSRNSAEAMPTQEVIDSYTKRIASWVFKSDVQR
ncbi:MAG: hypothetical protein K2Y09_01620 [Nitrosomonas sp.]|uniref:hypothetical protein n=1 Tax=Nitrosomonas sp. TaxID=42353 RepID=UPI001D874300|nr:hypothetical protein [Nitrosomonas sp.]MBX9893869.1 hypothetical protein [Nitrosomonas sp.]